MKQETNIAPSLWAERLMKKYASRTGLIERDSNLTDQQDKINQRYLWTDALAVLNFLALDNMNENVRLYNDMAQELINAVHEKLGKYSKHDERSGWISGLSEKKGKKHPTINGLRIGKDLPERKAEESYNAHLEWERDGQYFHYNSKWINTLKNAAQYLDKGDYLDFAAELSLAGSKFIYKEHGKPNMYWKMSIELDRPLVPSRGAHDPLEGLINAIEMQEYAQSQKQQKDFETYIHDLERICVGENWQTNDPLGIGGLFLLSIRANSLNKKYNLSSSALPVKLIRDAELSLSHYLNSFDADAPAGERLAFRECGLTLGLRVFIAFQGELDHDQVDLKLHPAAIQLADEIESFWLKKRNQEVNSFKNHLNINEVTVASSILASIKPQIFI